MRQVVRPIFLVSNPVLCQPMRALLLNLNTTNSSQGQYLGHRLLIDLFTILSQAFQSALETQEQCNSKKSNEQRKKGLVLNICQLPLQIRKCTGQCVCWPISKPHHESLDQIPEFEFGQGMPGQDMLLAFHEEKLFCFVQGEIMLNLRKCAGGGSERHLQLTVLKNQQIFFLICQNQLSLQYCKTHVQGNIHSLHKSSMERMNDECPHCSSASFTNSFNMLVCQCLSI